MTTKYILKKVEVATRQCQVCGGKGYHSRKTKSGTFKDKCTAAGCREGKYTIENISEVDLITALKELKLIT